MALKVEAKQKLNVWKKCNLKSKTLAG